MKTWLTRNRSIGVRTAARLFATACFLLAVPVLFDAQPLDICGCATIPGLQPFDSSNAATFPPGTTSSCPNGSMTMPLPADGILKFSSFRLLNCHLSFSRNAANSPATILVAGDASITSTFGCCFTVTTSGAGGSGGSSSFAGVGGSGGPGGFRGGDAASQPINGAAIGGAGFGPGGGTGGTAIPFANGGGGTFLGLPELLPLLGGSGGGGGSSTTAATPSCSGGGGGGGGGALLIAANGTMAITNYQLLADGGGAGGSGNGSCASAGGGGSGGAIRLVANRLSGAGSPGLFARGSGAGKDGRIRVESVDTSAQVTFNADPPALRIVGPTPIANPIAPTVTITSVGGAAVPAVPQGTFGAIDVVLPAPGATPVTVATTGVPSNTTVEVSVKPRIGGPVVSQSATLTDCNAAGACNTVATFNLAAGAYVVEARATFQLQ